MAQVKIDIAGRQYDVHCRDGEEESLHSAARLVDGKSREAIAGLGSLSESRQLLFASLMLADQLLDEGVAVDPGPPSDLAPRIDRLASKLESLASTLETAARGD